ncbi:uncharacterized protein [Prorops nasuta]|uniref:uncharacterized protein n=1 Tax=Prorops nasuta TaxID=863751 RepID=UPI0034D005DC
MWKFWILLLSVTVISSALVEPQSFSINPPTAERISSSSSNSRPRNGRQNESAVRRFACPVGFFRLKRFCYYLSGGTAPWREAYFHCKDRNSTLAILDRNGKDRMLRKYLMGEQFTKLERWIGGIYNWEQMAWEWGVTGEKMEFQSFAKIDPSKSKRYAWHCVIMDPAQKYKWAAQLCTTPKHYVCEVAAGPIARRRKKTTDDPFAPQYQRVKPRKGAKKYLGGHVRRPNRRNHKMQSVWGHDWQGQNSNQQWAHGVNLGSRPPTSTKRQQHLRHHANRTRHNEHSAPKVAQVYPRGREYVAFSGSLSTNSRNQVQSLSDANKLYSQFHNNINDLAHEEILLKP